MPINGLNPSSLQEPTPFGENGTEPGGTSSTNRPPVTTSRPQGLVDQAGHRNVPLQHDSFGAASGTSTSAPRANILSSPPSLPVSSQPANYQTNLQSANGKLTPMTSTGGSNADAAALAVVQNGGSTKVDTAASQAREETVKKQAESLANSAAVSHKTGCHTKFENHAELTRKLQAAGMTSKQAQTIARTLEDGRVSPAAKSKISFELASLGVTAAGENNIAPTASNKADVLAGLKTLADKEGNKLSSIANASSAAGVIARFTPVGSIVNAIATHNATGKVMSGVEADSSVLAGAKFDGPEATLIADPSAQAVQSVYDQTLRPALTAGQQSL